MGTVRWKKEEPVSVEIRKHRWTLPGPQGSNSRRVSGCSAKRTAFKLVDALNQYLWQGLFSEQSLLGWSDWERRRDVCLKWVVPLFHTVAGSTYFPRSNRAWLHVHVPSVHDLHLAITIRTPSRPVRNLLYQPVFMSRGIVHYNITSLSKELSINNWQFGQGIERSHERVTRQWHLPLWIMVKEGIWVSTWEIVTSIFSFHERYYFYSTSKMYSNATYKCSIIRQSHLNLAVSPEVSRDNKDELQWLGILCGRGQGSKIISKRLSSQVAVSTWSWLSIDFGEARLLLKVWEKVSPAQKDLIVGKYRLSRCGNHTVHRTRPARARNPRVIFPKKWPCLWCISWPLAKTRSGFIASVQHWKLKHKVPKVWFVQYNVATCSLCRMFLFWTSHFRLSDQYMDQDGYWMLQNHRSYSIAT